jgi:hypothetical protein
MASTYSNLKIQLMATGENSGTWGNVTNTNLGTALEQAITGSVDVTVSSNVTLSLTDTNAAQDARALRLNIGGSGGFNLTVPNIQKLYLVNNATLAAVVVKNASGSTVTVPTAKTMWVYSTGSGVVDAVTYLSSLTLGSALPIASGGTGSTSTTYANLQSNVSGTLPIANGGTGSTSTTYANLQTNVTGILPNANTTATASNGASTIVARDASGNFTAATITATTFSGSGASLTSLNATNISSGTVPTARLGSGTADSSTFLRGDQTYAAVTSLPGGQGQVFTSNGTFTIPTGITALKVTVVGGGGGGNSSWGQNTDPPANGTGGGSGATAISYLTGLTPGNTLAVTVGAGGTSPNAYGGLGAAGTGGSSTVASGTQSISTITGGGGAGGGILINNQGGLGGAGGTASGGTINIPGSRGGFAIRYISTGDGQEWFNQPPNVGFGAPSLFSGPVCSQTTSSISIVGTTGALYGGGGSGAKSAFGAGTNTAGGVGAPGIVIFEF